MACGDLVVTSVFLCLALTFGDGFMFPALDTSFSFSTFDLLHIFPRSNDTGCIFSRASAHVVTVFPRLTLGAHFPTNGNSYMFTRA